MAFSVLRWISQRASSSSTRSSSSNLFRRCISGGRLGAPQTRVCDEAVVLPSTLPSRISPWLMIPSSEEGVEQKAYRFYSLAENRVVSVPAEKSSSSSDSEEQRPDEDALCLGSSHGWLFYLNRSHNGVFLSNPLSGRHIKLPSLAPVLSHPPEYFSCGGCALGKMILSCPPPDRGGEDDDECRAMMVFDCQNRLAFCCPGRPDASWIVIGDRVDSDGDVRSYRDMVYSSTHKLFYCMLQWEEMEAWDLHDPSSPRMIPMDDIGFEHEYMYFSASQTEEEIVHKAEFCRRLSYLVEHDGDLFLVRRFIYEHTAPDGSYVDPDSVSFEELHSGSDPLHKTVDFEVFRYDMESRVWRYLERSLLDGLALFIGFGHSFVLPTSSSGDFPELKPDSIYFTDDIMGLSQHGAHDIGIFDYKDKTFSPCYFPCDRPSFRRIKPAPLWFTPNPL